jgi:predicted transcriptional regulator
MTDAPTDRGELLSLTADIVAAYAGHNSVASVELPNVINSVFDKLSGLGAPAAEPEPVPAVPARKSVTPDFLVCLECGKKAKMLKRHLTTAHDMTPTEYRTKWQLGPTYPMVAQKYSEARMKLAKQFGLGRKPAKPKTRRNAK